jgi:SAM-dependent methyltransferase
MSIQIIEGDCRDMLATLPAQSVHCCVTSPPYFGLRDYGVDGQIGLEPTPDEFVAELVAVFREVRRVLRDDGRLLLVVPNRTGLWAHLDRTPFGHGQPYSRGQIERLLARHLFRAERREAALFVPPYGLGRIGSAAPALEGAGRTLCPRLAGVFIVEAEKDLFAAVPAGAVRLRRRVVAPA